MTPATWTRLAVLASAALLAAGLVVARQAPSTVSTKPVARIWKGRTLTSKADEYQRYLDTGITKVRSTPDNRGVSVLRRSEGDQTEFLVLSVWESVDAIKKFAGEDYRKAVLLPRDREYLLEVEPNVLHYEIIREERGH
jgi:heme-degrading monooxygenase HmoA